MGDDDPLEPGTHVFSGNITVWRPPIAEIVTDSGLTVPLSIDCVAAVAVGTRVTIVARRIKPRYQVVKITRS